MVHPRVDELARTERWMKWVIYFVGAALLTAAASLAEARPKEICHVSLLGFGKENAQLKKEMASATGLSFMRLRSLVDFFENDPKALKSCLEGGYRTVLITSHSALVAPEATALVYFTQYPGHVGTAMSYLSDRFFAKLQPSSHLRQILIATSQAELLKTGYPALFALADLNRVPTPIAISTAAAERSQPDAEGILALRSYRSAAELLRDALQDQGVELARLANRP